MPHLAVTRKEIFQENRDRNAKRYGKEYEQKEGEWKGKNGTRELQRGKGKRKSGGGNMARTVHGCLMIPKETKSALRNGPSPRPNSITTPEHL